MAYDEDGRAFVAEMNDYPYTDAATHQAWKDNTTDAPIGRIRLLVDDDGDGDFDRSTLFADDLSWPTGVACYKGGVFVARHAGRLVPQGHRRRRQGRRQAQGLHRLPQVQRPGGDEQPRLGPRQLPLRRRRQQRRAASSPGDKPDAEPVTLSRNDFRFDPATEQFEPIPGGARFGNAFDDWGNRFVCNIRNPAQHVVVETRYLARNPHVTVAERRPRRGPLRRRAARVPHQPRRSVARRPREPLRRRAAKQPRSELVGGGVVTSASGITIYRGDAYPPEFRGQLFVGEVANNLIHRQVDAPGRRDVQVEPRRREGRVRRLDRRVVPPGELRQRAGRHAARAGHVPRGDRAPVVDPRRHPRQARPPQRRRPRADLPPRAAEGFQVPEAAEARSNATTAELVETLRNPNAGGARRRSG